MLLIGFLYAVITLMYAVFHISLSFRDVEGVKNGALPHLHATETDVLSTSPLEDTSAWKRVLSLDEILLDSFYRLRSVGDGRWLGHSSGGVYGIVPEKTLAILRGRKNGTFAIQGWSTLFLSVHSGKFVGMDRTQARSAEMWKFVFPPKTGFAVLWSPSMHCFIRIFGDHLKCDVKELRDATEWEMFVEPNQMCRSPSTGEVWDTVARLCWGLADTHRNNLKKEIIIFGTLKPLKSLVPDEGNAHDPLRIANRTLFNWALIEGVRPVVLSEDPLNHKLIEEINLENKKRGVGQQIDIIKDFEIQEKFRQPTYRGLFLRVGLAYPDAQAIMYSNMDILFSQSTVDSINAIHHYHRIMAQRNPALKGWFAIGRRTNVDIPVNWTLRSDWEKDVEVNFRTIGVPFQSLSEDYFAMSHNMFDWTQIPDFVVGGTAFDNWVTTRAVLLARAGQAVVVESTLTLTAIHQNHGENVKASHHQPKSRYNNILARQNGGWSLGHTTDAPLISVSRFGIEVLIFDRLALLVA
ncbi:uncharacterized protein TM35_000172900 [Trypanosoma theileri]|uniref:Nucleotide-diphospho-sugar transferase domain-containing protein n=1 Tax=Trypanosoma theileri TaxID=67003 RepID=A0A1X0NV43_9TRYP|nr:uncharacterized protein TM35_000172900 [Trypanosoma theileri]ORC88418.1 hypothetical protein TM35_000172900 [Trypanosoma theileri]